MIKKGDNKAESPRLVTKTLNT